MEQGSDAELLAHFLAEKDQAAFATLVQRHGPMVLGVCRRRLRNSADADDAFQATFLVLALKARSIQKQSSLADWLLGVAVRTSQKLIIAGSRRQKLLERVMRDARPKLAADAVEHAELSALLDRKIQRLPANCRKVVVLCWLEGKSKSAAAAELGWPEGTVATRIARARDILRKRLSGAGIAGAVTAFNSDLVHQLNSAVVPPLLAASTAQSATAIAIGDSAAHAAPAAIVQLAREVCRAMSIAKIKIILVVLMTMLLASAGLSRAIAKPAVAATKPGVDPAADALLDKCAAQLAALRRYSMHVEHSMKILHNIEESKRFGGWIATSDLRVDGDRYDLIDDTWDIRAGQEKPHRQFRSRSLWDGKRQLNRQQYLGEPGDKTLATVSSHAPTRFFAAGDQGLVLYGLAYGDERTIPQVMRESGVAKLRAADEQVDGHLCKVVDAHTRRGDYTLWIDATAGDLFRRARAIKRPGDLSYSDRPIAAHGTESTTTGMDLDLHDIQIDQINGQFVLTHCVEEWKTFVGDQGQYRLDRSTYIRSNVDLNPDFAKLGAFAMDGVPEGYTLHTLDKDGPYVHNVLHWVHGDVDVTPAPAPMTTALPSRKPRVGSSPPDIQGVDMAGKPMKLSDYRGKVVVVVFWSTSCGPCMTMVPHERELAEKLKGKPFVLLGVNAWDSHDTAAATIAKEQMTWPSWFDNGMHGPICRRWDIHALPAIFVLDAKGVVRYEDVRGGNLDQAVYSLLEQVQ